MTTHFNQPVGNPANIVFFPPDQEEKTMTRAEQLGSYSQSMQTIVSGYQAHARLTGQRRKVGEICLTLKQALENYLKPVKLDEWLERNVHDYPEQKSESWLNIKSWDTSLTKSLKRIADETSSADTAISNAHSSFRTNNVQCGTCFTAAILLFLIQGGTPACVKVSFGKKETL